MGYLRDRLFTLYHSLSPSALVSSNTGGLLALIITENWMAEVIQTDTFSRLVAEKDGEIVYLKYVTLFVPFAFEKPEINVWFILFGENYINLSFCINEISLYLPKCLPVLFNL